MKNVIKKTCAIVMMTAVLFTAVAPKPVLAACNHSITTTDVNPDKVQEYYTSTTHNVNGKTCTIYIYKVYQITEKCLSCGHLFKTYLNLKYVHSVDHTK